MKFFGLMQDQDNNNKMELNNIKMKNGVHGQALLDGLHKGFGHHVVVGVI